MVDQSGMRIHYTYQKRQYDAAILQTGRSVGPFQMIPEGLKLWQTIGYCPEDCTRRVIRTLIFQIFNGYN